MKGNEELPRNIEEFNLSEYEKKVDVFLEKDGVHEDGHASERTADYILKLLDKSSNEEN